MRKIAFVVVMAILATTVALAHPSDPPTTDFAVSDDIRMCYWANQFGIYWIVLYRDLDRSGSLSDGDVVLYDRSFGTPRYSWLHKLY